MRLFIILYTTIFIGVGCSTPQHSVTRLNIALSVKYQEGRDLSDSALPAKELKIAKTTVDIDNLDRLKFVVSELSRSGDELLSEIFIPIHGEQRFEIQVVATDGIPVPYDAWTAEFSERFAIFINLSQWDKARIDRLSLPIIKHEVAHVLMKPVLKVSSESRPVEVLKHIVINEGIAHFIGYARDRNEILQKKSVECSHAESELKRTLQALESQAMTVDAEKLLKKANTGSYWEKFGAIAGMCRAARVYAGQGAAGLVAAIKNSRLD